MRHPPKPRGQTRPAPKRHVQRRLDSKRRVATATGVVAVPTAATMTDLDGADVVVAYASCAQIT